MVRRPMSSPRRPFFTIDVEDWTADFPDLESRGSRLGAPLSRILDLLDQHASRATLFMMTEAARQEPALVRRALRAGHRIGLHGLEHRLVYELTPARFRAQLREGKRRLEELTGGAVTAYRAPFWSITKRSMWAVEELVEAGFEVDSSIFPTRNHLYGIPDAPIDPYWLRSGLAEFPPSVLRVAGRNVPFGGGFYLRASPLWLTRELVRRTLAAGRAVMLYVHPWELDTAQPRDLPYASRLARLIHYHNLESTEARLRALLTEFGPSVPLPQTAPEAAGHLGQPTAPMGAPPGHGS